MSAPAFIAQSGLAGAGGWMDVNKHTLQHTKYPNVFGLGDCTNTPNGKTAAAITSQVKAPPACVTPILPSFPALMAPSLCVCVVPQAPVVVHNLQRAMNNQPLNGYYHGYGSCPLMVNTFRVILAEFGYDGVIMETFPYQMGAVQERIFAFIKREVFPFCYWHFMPRGMWYGKDTFFKPDVTKNPPVVPGTQVCG
jgi:sulfide:quinone oxidoreductase